ncbi:uncharacterized protein LOC135096195 [Scylla paramamosain]|uniref:uncharacterized protein LOC135096195 n=1 Tax=Scylla paramamosain TaxID=85552 RepID=UPI003083D857
MAVVPLCPALLDCYSKHNTSGLYSSQLSCVTYYQHIIGFAARFHSVLFGTDWRGIQHRLHRRASCGGRVGGSTGWFAASVVYALTLAVANIIFFAVFFQELLPEGLMTMIPAFILIGASKTKLGLYSGLTLYAIGSSLMVPCLTALASCHGTASHKGTLFGIQRSPGAVPRTFGPVVISIVLFVLFECLAVFCVFFGVF